jgi:hypothetical protein
MALVQLEEGVHGTLEALTAGGEDGKMVDQVGFEDANGLEVGAEVVKVSAGRGGEDRIIGGVGAMGEGVAAAGGLALGGARAGRALGVGAIGSDLGSGSDHKGTSLLKRTYVLILAWTGRLSRETQGD